MMAKHDWDDLFLIGLRQFPQFFHDPPLLSICILEFILEMLDGFSISDNRHFVPTSRVIRRLPLLLHLPIPERSLRGHFDRTPAEALVEGVQR